jgi:hypothetical protein
MKIGETQASVLRSLIDHKSWKANGLCGWTWGTYGQTKRVMESLVKKGLASLEDGYYKPTQLGIELNNTLGTKY